MAVGAADNVTNLIYRYFALGGAEAEKQAPKLDAKALDQIVRGEIPTVAGKPNVRRWRNLIENMTLATMGARLALKGMTLEAALAGIEAAVEKKATRIFVGGVDYLRVDELTEALSKEKIDLGTARTLLAQHICAFSPRRTSTRPRRTPRASRTTSRPTRQRRARRRKRASRPAVPSGAKSPHSNSFKPRGISAVQLIDALKRAYIHRFGYLQGHIGDAVARRTSELKAFTPYLGEITLTPKSALQRIAKSLVARGRGATRRTPPPSPCGLRWSRSTARPVTKR